MKLAQLAKELGISTESFIKFIQDFDLELSECITTHFEVQKDFEKFARENIKFLKSYATDLVKSKSVNDIADKIDKPVKKVEEIIRKKEPKFYDNGKYKSSISSFSIDNQLGGNYQFIYNYFGKSTLLQERDFIGYRDLFFYISDALSPFLDRNSIQDWGIYKPSGILLYGPPGSGKIFWANKIADIINYEFKEIRKYFLSTIEGQNEKDTFPNFLNSELKNEKVLLFMDNFEKIMAKNNDDLSSSSNEKVKEIILHSINRLNDEKILLVGSANNFENIDKEVLAPGRFDVLIPIFPPNLKERSEIILYYMMENLGEDALLLKLLKNNKAHTIPFWAEVSNRMKVFSITMIIDFTQSLKKKIRQRYQSNHSIEFTISESMLESALEEASAKLTEVYLNQIEDFIIDVSTNQYTAFAERIEILKKELQYYKVIESPGKPIGFNHNDQ